MISFRYFKSINTLTIPSALQVGAGGVHDRAAPGDVLAFDAEKCRKEDRFINGRLRAGDLVETNKATYEAFVATPAPTIDEHDTTPAVKAAKGK